MTATTTRGHGARPRTLLDKVWDAHVVIDEPECPAVLYIDLHLVHEVTDRKSVV